ncbi:MAG: hypothetical protein ABIK77_03130 [candidate division WOR-3 bacterium]
MKIFKYYVKSLFLSKETFFWSIIFVVFWLFMGAYLFGKGMSKDVIAFYEVKIGYTASWYGVAVTFSLAALCVSLCYYFLYVTSSLPYIIKYGKISPISFFSQIILGTFVYSFFLAVILIICTYLIFSHAFSCNLLPAKPLFAFLVVGISGIFYYLLATMIVFVLMLIKKVKSIRLVSFFPMMTNIALVYSQIFGVANQTMVYASPFNNIYNLSAYVYFGKPIPLKWNELLNKQSLLIHPCYSIIILLIWMAILFIIDIYLMRSIKEIPIEEMREI